MTIAGATRAGSEPARGYSGDGGPARRALLALAELQNECDPLRFEQMSRIVADANGTLYLSDSANQRIRRIGGGVIDTVAGNGERPPIDPRTCTPTGGNAAIGEGGPALSARLNHPSGLAIHPNGSLIIADQQNNRIRVIGPGGTISTIAGNGLHAFYAPQIPATSSGLDWPTAVAVDGNGLVCFSELHSGRVARIGADGRLTTIAGSGIPGFNGDSGAATAMRLSNPTGIAFDAQGNLYIADQGNHRIRKVTPAGALTTIAGSAQGFGGDGGPAASALLDRPSDVKVDASGNIYVADMGNHRVRRIDAAGVITTIAGDGSPARGRDGIRAAESSLFLPAGLALDASGDLYIVDWGNYIVRKVTFRNLPVVTSSGVLNGASFRTGPMSRGSLVSIFGANLAGATAEASSIPLPRELGGVTVRVNGAPVPLVFVSPSQINAQLPYDLAAGEAEIAVTTASGASPAEYFDTAPSAIGVFVVGQGRAIALNQDGALNGPESAESRGRVLTLFLTGIGPVTPEIAAGAAAPFDVLHRATSEVSATIGGVSAPIEFLGLTPGFAGLAQANVRVPEGAPAGAEVALVFRSGSHISNEVTVSLR